MRAELAIGVAAWLAVGCSLVVDEDDTDSSGGLVSNGGFEDPGLAWQSVLMNAELTVQGDVVRGGKRALRIRTTDSSSAQGAVLDTGVIAEPGTVYRFLAHLRCEVPVECVLRLAQTTGDSTINAQDAGHSMSSCGQWEPFAVEAAYDEANELSIAILVPDVRDQVLYVDDVRLEAVTP